MIATWWMSTILFQIHFSLLVQSLPGSLTSFHRSFSSHSAESKDIKSSWGSHLNLVTSICSQLIVFLSYSAKFQTTSSVEFYLWAGFCQLLQLLYCLWHSSVLFMFIYPFLGSLPLKDHSHGQGVCTCIWLWYHLKVK